METQVASQTWEACIGHRPPQPALDLQAALWSQQPLLQTQLLGRLLQTLLSWVLVGPGRPVLPKAPRAIAWSHCHVDVCVCVCCM